MAETSTRRGFTLSENRCKANRCRSRDRPLSLRGMPIATTQSVDFSAKLGFTGVKRLRVEIILGKARALVKLITKLGSPSFVFLQKGR